MVCGWHTLIQSLPSLACGGVRTVQFTAAFYKVNKRRLDAGVSQPSAEVIQGYPVQQQVTGVAVPQRVSADVPAAVQPARVNRPFSRQLDPPPGRCP